MRRTLALIAALVIFVAAALPARAAVMLQVGSKGENVRKVQERLIHYNYLNDAADGVFGQATLEAVKRFQQQSGLTADGKVGPSTAAALGVTLTGSGGDSAAASSSAAVLSSDHMLLARLVYAEARGETYKGQVAVAAVVLNRVKNASFPNTISGVIYQKGAFSCVSNGQINKAPGNDAIRAARDAMNGWDPTGGCLYFFNPKTTSDSWIRTRTVKTVIGNHKFAV